MSEPNEQALVEPTFGHSPGEGDHAAETDAGRFDDFNRWIDKGHHQQIEEWSERNQGVNAGQGNPEYAREASEEFEVPR